MKSLLDAARDADAGLTLALDHLPRGHAGNESVYYSVHGQREILRTAIAAEAALPTREELAEALRRMIYECRDCGGSGRATESVEDDTPCPVCNNSRAQLARYDGVRS